MKANRERGSALLATVIVAMVLGLTCAALVITSAANATASQNAVRRSVALSVAEIAVERAKCKLYQGGYNALFASHSNQATETGTVFGANSTVYGTYSLHITAKYGNVDGQYRVRAMGTTGRVSRQIEVVLKQTPPKIPKMLSAINLYNANALANFSGSPPRVSGMDTNLPGVSWDSAKASDCTVGNGAGPHAVGVGVHDNPSVASIISALGKWPDRVDGTNGAGGTSFPSVYNIAQANPTGQIDPLTASDVASLAHQYEAVADYVYDGSTWHDANGTITTGSLGTTAEPMVVAINNHGQGTIHLNGNLAGVGVLIIDSDVQFGGTFNYAGLIIITTNGSATVDVDMRGTPLVLGSILAANPLNQSTSILDLRGTADVFYSTQGLGYAQMALDSNARFDVKFYSEKRPNANDFQYSFQWF
jgi:hypothetical protein